MPHEEMDPFTFDSRLGRHVAYLAEQMWGPAIRRGDVAVVAGPHGDPAYSAHQSFWVIPSFSRAKFLVPRDFKVASRSLREYALLRSLRTRAVRRVLSALALMRIPLSNDVVTVSSTVSTGDIIQAVGASVGHAKVRASLGVRSAANAKPTLELRSTCGDILGFAKLGWNGITIPSIDNEARALRELAPYAVTPFRAAGVIAEGTVQDRRFVVTEPMPIRVRDVPPRAHSLSASEARGPAPLVGMHPWSALAQVTSVVSTVFDDDQTTPPALAVEVRRVVDRILDQAPVLPAAGFWHGDFVCWNLARDGDGALWLFDWETAEEDVPAGMDTMHWYSNAQGPVDPKRTRERVAAAFETAKPVLRSMGYSSRTMRYLGAWYSVTLVARAIRLARALEGWERVALKPDTLAELLTWANQILDNATPQKEARR